MCSAPDPPKPKEPKKPQFLRNRYLDEFVGDVKSLKAGRSSLRTPLSGPDTSTPAPVATVAPVGNTNPANVTPRLRDFRPIGGRTNRPQFR